MIKLQMAEPYVDTKHLQAVCNIVNNGLYQLGLLPYQKVEVIREMIKNRPQRALKQLCCELVRIANVPIRKEIKNADI